MGSKVFSNAAKGMVIMMKKRFLAITLVLCLSFLGVLATSCQRELTAAELLQKADEKTMALEAYSAVMDLQIDMDMMGFSMEIPMTVDMKVKNPLDNPTTRAKYSMDMLGQTIEMDIYMEDGWMYFSMGETEYTEAEQYKTNMAEFMAEYDFTGDAQDLLKELPDDLLADVVPVKNEDGSRTVSVVLSADVFNEVFAELVESIGETSGAEGDISIGDAKVEITVLENGYYSDYKVEYQMSVNVSGIDADCNVVMSMHYNDPGTPVEITPPEGYMNYPELEY